MISNCFVLVRKKNEKRLDRNIKYMIKKIHMLNLFISRNIIIQKINELISYEKKMSFQQLLISVSVSGKDNVINKAIRMTNAKEKKLLLNTILYELKSREIYVKEKEKKLNVMRNKMMDKEKQWAKIINNIKVVNMTKKWDESQKKKIEKLVKTIDNTEEI